VAIPTGIHVGKRDNQNGFADVTRDALHDDAIGKANGRSPWHNKGNASNDSQIS
jgi:hypothetical protein